MEAVYLRSREMGGYKFRRQHPIGSYIVDFCCLDRRLIIEVDGGQHVEAIEKDRKRTTFLEMEGFCVIRFWDNEVLKNTEALLERILSVLDNHPHPHRCKLKPWLFYSNLLMLKTLKNKIFLSYRKKERHAVISW